MKTYCGRTDFKTLYYNFIIRDTSGKLFLMEDYQTESMHLGSGATIFIEKTTSFLLNTIKDWYDEKPQVLIGDIPMLEETIKERQKKNIQYKIQKGKHKFNNTHKVALQLHNILRKQQKLNRIIKDS